MANKKKPSDLEKRETKRRWRQKYLGVGGSDQLQKKHKEIYAVTFETNRKNRESELILAIRKAYPNYWFTDTTGYDDQQIFFSYEAYSKYPKIKVGEF